MRCAKHTYNTRPFENGSAGRREEGLASLTPCTKNEKDEVKRPFLIPERSVKHANYNKGQGLRADSGKSEVRYDYYDVYNRLQFVHTHCS